MFVEPGLVQTMGGGKAFGLGIKSEGYGLSVVVYLDPRDILNLAPDLFAGLALNDLDASSGFLPPDEVLGPSPGVQGRINQLGPGIGLAQASAVLPPYSY